MDSNPTDANPAAPSSSTSAPSIPPLAAITPTDHTGIVLIGTALALVFSVVSMLIRIYIRLQFRHEFSLDDISSISAVVGLDARSCVSRRRAPRPPVLRCVVSIAQMAVQLTTRRQYRLSSPASSSRPLRTDSARSSRMYPHPAWLKLQKVSYARVCRAAHRQT